MRLKKGQILYINNQKYTIINMIEFQEDSWIWQEYEVITENCEHQWLVIEEENHQLVYSLYKKYREKIEIKEKEIIMGDQTYELYEEGTATVKNYFGNADVDPYETCVYDEYRNKENTQIITVEKWEDETEVSMGHEIPKEQIRIIEEFDKSQVTKVDKERSERIVTFGKNFMNILLFLLILFPIGFSMFGHNKSIQKYLEKTTTKYTYVTSVTNNTNNKKAKVYEASFSSIDLTVKDIIDGLPEEITDTIDSNPYTQADGIGLQTKKEYAYIYEENGKIYIQVSSKEYVRNSGTAYHSRHHSYYYSTYNSTSKSSVYSNYASSARQKSINSRTSSGGGTSSGK